MRSFRKIVLFILLLIAVDQLVGLYMDGLYEKNTCMHSGGELNDYLKNRKADIVFVGSSRVNTMIDPEIFGPKALNVSKLAKHFLYNLSVVNLMDQHGKMPSKLLVMNIEVEDIYAENHDRLVDDVFYLKYYYGQNKFITKLIQSKNRYERFKFLSSSYRFNGENFKLITNPLQSICQGSKNGYTPLQRTANDSLRLAVGVEEMKKLAIEKVDPRFFQAMQQLIELCQKNNVQLVLLYAPNFYYPDSFRKASLKIQTFCRQKNIPYIDFSLNENPVFKNRNLWYDHIHLNIEGSVIYSQLLKKELEKLNLKIIFPAEAKS